MTNKSANTNKVISIGKGPSISYYNSSDRIYQVRMSVDEWISIPAHPAQRNTALRAGMKHLLKPTFSHAAVTMAAMKDGSICMVDGHTRAYKWERGTLGRPDSVIVNVFSLDTVEDLNELYDCYDSDGAVKQATDKTQSAMSSANISFVTPWMNEGRFSSMLNLAATLAYKKVSSRREVIGLFGAELALLDSISPKRGRGKFSIGDGAAAILSLKKHGATALDFWHRYNHGVGVIDDGRRDMVQFLIEETRQRSLSKSLAGRGNNVDLCCFALSCVEGSFGGGTRKNRPRSTDATKYL